MFLMEVNNNQIGSNNPSAVHTGSSAPKADLQRNIEKAEAVKPTDKPEDLKQNPSEEKEISKFKVMNKISQQLLEKFSYPVSDTRFTIYKDAGTGGEQTYFTRFTNLRDGTVKTYPEVELFDIFKKTQSGQITSQDGTIFDKLV